MAKTISRRPYLLRAMHEWMTDNVQTPHILVDARAEGVNVPARHVKDGKIILNVSASATKHLHIGNDRVEFEARFGGIPFEVDIPVRAVLAIYARETGQGMIFTDEDAEMPAENGEQPDVSAKSKRPDLKIIK